MCQRFIDTFPGNETALETLQPAHFSGHESVRRLESAHEAQRGKHYAPAHTNRRGNNFRTVR